MDAGLLRLVRARLFHGPMLPRLLVACARRLEPATVAGVAGMRQGMVYAAGHVCRAHYEDESNENILYCHKPELSERRRPSRHADLLLISCQKRKSKGNFLFMLFILVIFALIIALISDLCLV